MENSNQDKSITTVYISNKDTKPIIIPVTTPADREKMNEGVIKTIPKPIKK